MPARKNQHVTFDRTHAAHNAVGPRADLARRLSSGAAVTEELPVRALHMDLSRAAALILAVVPLDQVGIDFGRGPKACQFAGPHRALQWAGEDPGNSQSAQPLTEGAGIAFAALGQRQVGPAGVLPREAPGGLPVPRQVYNRKRFAHGPVRSLERPLPIRDLRRIYAELVGVILTCDLLVEQGLASARPGHAETRHAVDRVYSQAESIGLVLNGELQRCVDVALLLVAAHVNVVLMRPVVGEPVDQPGVGVEV